jgi:hypothetical protein
MKEPSLGYSVIQYRKQKSYECVANSICALIEKQFQLKGTNVKFDAGSLDDKLRFDQKRPEGLGISLSTSINFVFKNGIDTFKIKHKEKLPLKFDYILERLKSEPLLIRKKSYKNGIKDKTYLVGEEKKTTHACCLWGWDGENFLVLDSQASYLVKLPENLFLIMVLDIYSMTV